MIPWEFIDSARVPGKGGKLCLYRRGGEFSIRVDGSELMNSRIHGSEEALAEHACAKIAGRLSPTVLIGGLGMGYTMSAALKLLDAGARVVVAELVPAVVEWNRGPLSDLAGHPLEDSRVTVCEADVAGMLRAAQQAYDAVLLDVDNGPQGLTREDNDWLYSRSGLDAAFSSLKPGGVLAVWSASPDRAFTRLLCRAGFGVEEVCVRARGARGGARHTIWIAGRGS